MGEQRDKPGVGSLVKFRSYLGPAGEAFQRAKDSDPRAHILLSYFVFISEPANIWENFSCDSDLWLYIAEEVVDFCVPGL